MLESSVSQATLINRQLSGTNNQAQQKIDASSSSKQEEAGSSQPTSSNGVNGANVLQDRVAISSAPSDQVNRAAETTEQPATYNAVHDQSNDLARKQAEGRTDQAALGNLLDIKS
ncbi:hypothetical protein SAMN02745127_02539 [Oceanospirillum multiglobuliferum]|uniref:Uncharacterized protein n=1 Tax=Oceanospirillum multiglobuliferum TaxID=64969 RepID=A0A1T4RRE9_9GAMM|nr:hypothetical protein [Oceanospirillum multiglobuliferum]OPX54700.1 hypothetical protein BTE48_13045 [Oceanospirillum multiglobuliferum]SKA18512.1 hypothetical protein SAMN02745127_02539 [Oceanospirillum multiglobuliferum]